MVDIRYQFKLSVLTWTVIVITQGCDCTVIVKMVDIGYQFKLSVLTWTIIVHHTGLLLYSHCENGRYQISI